MHRPIIAPPLPRFISPGAASAATAIVTLLLGAAAWPPGGHHSGSSDQTSAERVRYLLPLLPPRVPAEPIHVEWMPDAPSVGGIELSGTGDGTEGTGSRGGGGVPTKAIPPAPDVSAPDVPDSALYGGSVYVESETDQPVVRDPSSAAPAYPHALEQQRVEGTVTVSFVVDTSGLADSSTMNVRSVTHPLFADAVRAALPSMRFQPAELAGRRVRQLVIQEFRFVLPTQTQVVKGVQRSSTQRVPTAN